MAKETLTKEECLCVILYYAKKCDLPPEEVRRIIGERMAAEGVDELGNTFTKRRIFDIFFAPGRIE